MTVVPYSPSPFSHCRFTPTHGAKFMQPAVEFDSSLLWLLRPKQFGQACLPVQDWLFPAIGDYMRFKEGIYASEKRALEQFRLDGGRTKP